MALFDTDILIDHLRGKPEAKQVLEYFQFDKKYCSVITSAEILFGMRPNEERLTLALLNQLEEIPVTPAITKLVYDIRNRAKGHHLELFDCLIAATALYYHQPLVSCNRKHYPDKRLSVIVPY